MNTLRRISNRIVKAARVLLAEKPASEGIKIVAWIESLDI